MTDIEIAQAHEMKPITEIAAAAGINEQHLELYGKYKAKLDLTEIRKLPRKAKLILVTAISPTPAGEGKTTTSVGLADALNKIGKKTMVCLREPSLGPVFGVKGGAAGGGYAQVVPMEDINLHFTGDFHAIGAANNLLAAMLDNHIQQGNALNIDPRRIVWKRAVDMNDRQLRHIIDGLGGKASGVPREDGFEITVASEIMAVLCLSSDLADLKARLAKMVVAYTYDDQPVTAHDLKAEGAMAALLKDAIKPNLVQTLEGTPAFIHGGPFANIAHGCNSLQATETAMRLSDYTVTEAGFAADLGAEKFLDIKCRAAGFHPNAVVIVATVRALKYHGGVPKAELNNENLEALEKGLPNLLQHVDNVKNVYGLPCVVAVNAFPTDTAAELALVESKCRELGVNVRLSEVWAKGGEGGKALAEEVVRLCEEPDHFQYVYDVNDSIEAKLNAIATKVYHADGVIISAPAKKQLKQLTDLGFDNLPICMAKTQFSFSDDAGKLGAPRGFKITVRDLKVNAGAGFLVAKTGDTSLHIRLEDAKAVTQRSAMRYDREGDNHYDCLSALMTSIRGSDPDAAIHYLARLLEAGDLPSACRRLMVIAAEDVGLAYPQIMPIVKSCVDMALMLGMPEARIPLGDAAVLMATSPKSNSGHLALDAAISDVQKGLGRGFPRQLQNVHADTYTQERDQGYLYPHDFPNHWVAQQYLPDDLVGKKYYEYGPNKLEQAARQYWASIKKEN